MALALLRQRLAAGRGGALVIRAGAGLGKSTLLASSVADATLRVSGRRAEADLPFGALHALLAASSLSGDPPLGPHLSRALAGGPAGRLGVGRDLLELVATAARAQPVICTVDDAQWLDRSSAVAIGFVAARVANLPAMVVIAQRDEGPEWDLPTVALPPLDEDASAALLAERAPDLPGDVVHALVALGEGNPGALIDLVDALNPAQRRGEAEPPTGLPATSAIRQHYQERFATLPPETQRLLRVVAADPQLSAGEAMRVAAALRLDLAAFEPAERAGLIQLDTAGIRFAAPLLRATIYESATMRERCRAHALLARIVTGESARTQLHRAAVTVEPDAALAGDLERAAVAAAGTDRALAGRALARAAELSVEPRLGATRLVAAARLAWADGQPHLARSLLRRVPAHALNAPDRAQGELLRGEIELRAGGSTRAGQALLAAADELTNDRDQRLTAMLRAGEALCLAGDYPEFGAVARQALALRRSDDPLPTQLVHEHFAGLAAMFEGDHARGIPALRRVIELAVALDEPSALLRASTAAIVLGDDARARDLALRVVTLARAAGERPVEPLALELVAAAECALGHYDAAAETLAQALPLARATGQDNLCSTVLGLMAVLAATIGDRETCLERIAQARAHGVSRSDALVEWALGLLDLVEGRPVEASARLVTLMGMDLGQGQLVIRIAATPHLVEAALRAGDRAAAEPAFAVFEMWAAATDNPAWLALAERCQALLQDDPDIAAKHFAVALEHHQAARGEFERARTQLLYGQELRRMRRPAAAREHLRLAAETFRKCRAVGLAEQAEAELRAAGDHVSPAGGSTVGVLTAQQLQIARLAAAGCTNREVAAALFLSTRTVDYHMRNILTRLGVRSRVDLVKLFG